MNVDTLQQMYEELAERHDRQQEARLRDNFLVLAADAALAAGHDVESERLRQRLLQLSPHSMLRPYASFAEAMQSSDIQDYVAGLRRLHPPGQAGKPAQGGNGKQPPDAAAAPVFRLQDPPPTRMPSSASQLPVSKPKRDQATSPYEYYDVPLPPGRSFEAWGSRIATLIFFLVFAAALCLGAYILARPFLQ